MQWMVTHQPNSKAGTHGPKQPVYLLEKNPQNLLHQLQESDLRTRTQEEATGMTSYEQQLWFSQQTEVPSCVECTDVVITAQCTDQCVVVACNDPEHVDTGDSSCCDTSPAPCTDCLDDCSGYDAFLQCCTEYHSYLPTPDTDFVWDPSLNALLREGNPYNTDAIMFTPSNTSSLVASPPLHLPSSSVSSETDIYPLSSPSPLLGPMTENSFSCLWNSCHAFFSTQTDLVNHVNLQHLRLPAQDSPPEVAVSPDIFSCLWGDCTIYPSIPGPSTGNTADAALGVLTTHLMQDHLGVPNRPPSPEPLEHVAHTDPITADPEHTCEEVEHICHWNGCGESFPTCDALTDHLSTVHVGSGKAHYDCFWLGCLRHGEKGFSSKQKISRHIQSHTGHRPFQCTVCHQNFSENATLQQHMRRHTREKPYVCDFPGCGKAFAITGALTIHKRTHNGLKPFKCTYCERAFAESSNLSKHLRTHTGERPYICSETSCNRSFSRPDQLSRHMNVHRGKKAAVHTS